MKMLKLLIIGLLMSGTVFAKDLSGHLTVNVQGMVCSFCAQGIEKKFKEEQAVDKIHVDLDKMQVHLMLKKDQKISEEQIKKIIEDSGFSFKGVKSE